MSAQQAGDHPVINSSSGQTGEVKRQSATAGGLDAEVGLNEQSPINQQSGTNATPSGGYTYGFLKRYTRFDPIAIVFTLLVFIGGIVGYWTKGSTVSLVSGTLFALLLASGTYLEGSQRNPYPLLVTLLGLGGMMAYRYYISMNFMPSGLIALLSFIMIARHSYLIYVRRGNGA